MREVPRKPDPPAINTFIYIPTSYHCWAIRTPSAEWVAVSLHDPRAILRIQKISSIIVPVVEAVCMSRC
jgi:hypothetical protein